MRISKQEYFKDIVQMVAKRSTCDRLMVGCILVKENRIIATGYNGALAGMPECDSAGHLMEDGHCIRAVHAEQNAIVQCALFGEVSRGSVAYVTHYPCRTCIKLLIAAGIKEIYYIHGNLHSDGIDEFDREITRSIKMEKI